MTEPTPSQSTPTAPSAPSPPAADVLSAVDGIEGWFSPDQVARISARAAAVPAGGQVVEIGSFRGRSTVAVGLSVADEVGIVAIDPHAGNDRGPQEIEGYEDEAAEDNTVFHKNLATAGVAERVRHVRKFSHDAHDDVTGEIDLLHIDGAHRFAPARQDIVTWGRRVKPGGVMLIHDSFSSVGVTLAILSSLLLSGRWRYVGRSRSLAEYRAESLPPLARVGNVGCQLAQLPWFVRNVAIKLLIVAKLPKAAQLLGHRDGDAWPY